MKLFNTKEKVVLSIFCFVLVAALALGVVIIKQNTDHIHIEDIEKNYTINNNLIADTEEKIKELEAKLDQKDESYNTISTQLEKAKKEKKKLQKENVEIRQKIENSNSDSQKHPSVYPPMPITGNKPCYLTFDDGPSENTLEILKILKTYNVKATFFVMNTENIDYVKKINDEGHAIGLHTATHKYEQIYKNTTAYFNDLNLISNMVKSVIDTEPKIMRFPGGSSNLVSKKYCRGVMSVLTKLVVAQGYSYFDWNVDSGDANYTTPAVPYIINNVLAGAKNKNRICVLMHDSKIKTSTVEALPNIIEGLIKMGFYFDVMKTDTVGFRHNIAN